MTTNNTHVLSKRTFYGLAVACSDDETRYNLQAPYCDGFRLVATDGHRLHAAPALESVPRGYVARPAKPKAAEAEQLAKVFADSANESQFPGWQKVLPSHETEARIVRVQTKKPFEGKPVVDTWKLSTIRALASDDLIAWIHPEHGVSIVSQQLRPASPPEGTIALNARYLCEAIQFVGDVVKPKGKEKKETPEPYMAVDGVTCLVGGPEEPVMLTSSDGRMAVIMPMRI